LTTFAKFVNLFPEIKRLVIGLFQKCSNSLDTEIQNRACEYMMLINTQSEELLQAVFEEMPPFPEIGLFIIHSHKERARYTR
jgi:AP-2 complex subunit alpha